MGHGKYNSVAFKCGGKLPNQVLPGVDGGAEALGDLLQALIKSVVAAKEVDSHDALVCEQLFAAGVKFDAVNDWGAGVVVININT